MNCELCGSENSEIFVLLPIRRNNGALETVTCLPCAEKSPAYCLKHKKPHLGFEDETTACMECIEEMVSIKKPRAAETLLVLNKNLPKGEFGRLLHWANRSSFGTADNPLICILRAIASRALRKKKSFEEMLTDVLQRKSAEEILPLEIESGPDG